MTTTKAKPIDTIREGSLKASIWKNTGEKGDQFSVQFSRTWRDEQGAFHDSDSFSGTELLRLARLANVAYDEIAIHRAKSRQEQA